MRNAQCAMRNPQSAIRNSQFATDSLTGAGQVLVCWSEPGRCDVRGNSNATAVATTARTT